MVFKWQQKVLKSFFEQKFFEIDFEVPKVLDFAVDFCHARIELHVITIVEKLKVKYRVYSITESK